MFILHYLLSDFNHGMEIKNATNSHSNEENFESVSQREQRVAEMAVVYESKKAVSMSVFC